MHERLLHYFTPVPAFHLYGEEIKKEGVLRFTQNDNIRKELGSRLKHSRMTRLRVKLPGFVFHFAAASNKLQIPLNPPFSKGEVKMQKQKMRSRIEVRDDVMNEILRLWLKDDSDAITEINCRGLPHSLRSLQ